MMDVPSHYIDFELIDFKLLVFLPNFCCIFPYFFFLFYLGYTTIRDLFLSEVGYIVCYMLFVSFGLSVAMLCSYLLSP